MFPLLSSCKKPDNLPTKPVPIDLTVKQAYVVTSANTFAFDMFNQILSAKSNANMLFSPLSISYALSMSVNGAANSTRDSIIKALRVEGITVDDLNRSYKDLTDALLKVDSRVIMDIANSVWTEKNFNVKEAFVKTLIDYYYAETGSFDINDPNAITPINKWISDHTNGLIKDMIDKLNSNDVMLLINAIYFKGKWQSQFDTRLTTARTFTHPDGSSADVPTMHQKESLKFYYGNGFNMAELPYGQGNYVMDIILPYQNDLSSVESSLTAEHLASWTGSMINRKVDLYLPRFKYGFKLDLNDILSSLGMGIAFGELADFSNASDIQLYISRVIHQATIETNEEGSEAAAATVITFGATSINPNDPVIFDVDHQFIYLIREVSTSSILFMGKVTDPLAN